MGRLSAILIILLAWLCLQAAPPVLAEPQQVVRMALEQNPPLSFVTPEGKAQGLFVDLMNEVARREGWQVQYNSCPQAACLAMLDNGQADFMAPLAWSPERAKRFLFSAADVATNWGVVYTRPNAHIHSFLDLADKRVGGVPNDIHFIRLKEQLQSFGIKAGYHGYPSFDSAFTALQQGKIDAAVVGRFFAMKRAAAYRIEATPIIFNPIHVHLAASPTINPALLTAFNRQLEQLKADPHSPYYASLEKWLTPATQGGVPQWFWYLLALLAAVALIMAVFVILLRRTVQQRTAKLQANERVLQAILDNTFQFQGLMTPDGTLLDANQSALKLIGATKNEVVGKKFWDTNWWRHDPASQKKLHDCIRRCGHGETVCFEATHIAADNRVVYVDFSLRPIMDEHGALLYLVPEGHDITEKKQLLADLQEKNSFLTTLFDTIPFDLWVRDRDRRLVLQNNHYHAHYQTTIGHTPEEDGLPPEIIYSWNLLYQQAFDGYTVDLDIRESEQIFHKLIVPVTIEGQINQILGLNIDQTDRLKTLEALRLSEKRFKAIFDEVPFIITLSDAQTGAFIAVNRFFTDCTGTPSDAAIGKTAPEINNYITTEAYAEILAEMQLTGGVRLREINLAADGGDTKHGLISCRTVSLGGKICNLTVIQDITQLKKAESALRETEGYLLQLVAKAPIGIAIHDGTHIRYANDTVSQLFQHATGEEMIGRPIHTLFAPEWQDEIRDRATRRMSGEAVPASYETVGMRLDGSLFPMQISVIGLKQAGQPMLIIFFQDLTEQKARHEQLIQHEKMLMISGLAAGMAHEINNPLGIIAQDLQNLERRLSPTLPKNRQVAQELGIDLAALQQYLNQREVDSYLANMQEAARRASRIIDNMLQFSRTSGSAHHPAPLFDLIEHAIELAATDSDLRKIRAFSNIRLIRDYTPDLPLVPLNLIEIEQVLINLLKNAAQALSGEHRQQAEIRISARVDGTTVVIAIADNGPGMDETVRRRIFEPFFTTKDIGKGTGLGLSVSHAIITRNHKGRLQVTSAPGQGSCFTITLPLHEG
jgi:PAS domain S-box-containing protein